MSAPHHRVVIADDAPLSRMLLRLILEDSRHFEVVGESGDGRGAVEVARAAHPDLVLLDISMPGMGGFEALPLVRDAVPEACIVMVSAHPANAQAARAFELGAHGYIEKEDDPDAFIAALLALLAAHRRPVDA